MVLPTCGLFGELLGVVAAAPVPLSERSRGKGDMPGDDAGADWPGAVRAMEEALVVLAICTDRPDPDADTDDVPLAEAAGIVLDALVGARAS